MDKPYPYLQIINLNFNLNITEYKKQAALLAKEESMALLACLVLSEIFNIKPTKKVPIKSNASFAFQK